MRQSLLDKLNENGYAVIDDFLTPLEVDELLAAGRALSLQAPTEGRKKVSIRDNDFMESGDKVRFFFENYALDDNGELLVAKELALNKIGHALHTEHPAFKAITFSDRVRAVCRQLGFRRPAIPQSMYIYKNPGIGDEVLSHQDSTFLHTEPESTVGLWIPLEDSTTQNGCLQFIKGSHKTGIHQRYIRNPDASSEKLLINDRPTASYPLASFTAVPVPKGSLVLIHGLVVHRSDSNTSPFGRPAYTFHVIESDGVEYSPENWLQAPAGKPFPVLYSNVRE